MKVPGNDQRRETHVCIDTWVHVVEHDVESPVWHRPSEARNEDVLISERQAVLFHCLRAQRRSRITDDAEGIEEPEGLRHQMGGLKRVDSHPHPILVENAKAGRDSGDHVEQDDRIEIPSPQHHVPVPRERLDQRFGGRTEAAIKDRIIFADRERLILLDRKIPQRKMRQGVAERSIAIAKISGDYAALDQGASRDVFPFECREAQETQAQVTVKGFERRHSILTAVKVDYINIQRLALQMA